jgi:hypothetical protein
MRVIGLDLAGLPSNPTGFALLSNRKFKTSLAHLDEEILGLCERKKPALVAIDAPLSLPITGNLRRADRLLIERGFRVFPPTFATMKALTARGIRLANELRAKGTKVIEIHPRTSGLIMFGSPDRRTWISELKKLGWEVNSEVSEHEVDAVIAALTGLFHLRGRTEEVGSQAEGTIVVPLGRLEGL